MLLEVDQNQSGGVVNRSGSVDSYNVWLDDFPLWLDAFNLSKLINSKKKVYWSGNTPYVLCTQNNNKLDYKKGNISLFELYIFFSLFRFKSLSRACTIQIKTVEVWANRFSVQHMHFLSLKPKQSRQRRERERETQACGGYYAWAHHRHRPFPPIFPLFLVFHSFSFVIFSLHLSTAINHLDQQLIPLCFSIHIYIYQKSLLVSVPHFKYTHHSHLTFRSTTHFYILSSPKFIKSSFSLSTENTQREKKNILFFPSDENAAKSSGLSLHRSCCFGPCWS